jgi:hypothetical protein
MFFDILDNNSIERRKIKKRRGVENRAKFRVDFERSTEGGI